MVVLPMLLLCGPHIVNSKHLNGVRRCGWACYEDYGAPCDLARHMTSRALRVYPLRREVLSPR